jgi:hypothetical protein
MTTIEKQIRSLEKLDDVILRDEHRLAETSAQLRQKRADAITARESLSLDVLRDSGVLELPPGEIVDLLSSLKVPSEAEHAGIPSAPPDASTAKAEKATERAKIPRPAMAARNAMDRVDRNRRPIPAAPFTSSSRFPAMWLRKKSAY